VSTLRLPGLILRLVSGQAARACSGLTPSTSLRASSERRFFTPSSKAGVRLSSRRSLGAVEWVKIILLINFSKYLASLSFPIGRFFFTLHPAKPRYSEWVWGCVEYMSLTESPVF
jgi:hypothetical protein